jgi:NOL1/NOP2/sun family putative RNA methylase
MNLKQEFIDRMKLLLENDFQEYIETLEKPYLNSIRCNTLKISIEELKKRLPWEINQPFKENPEIIVLKGDREPGEIGSSVEHLLGYFYIQEISSMMPPIALNPSENDVVLDLCASPGSKTTQIASMMKNKGSLLANDVSIGRIRILSSNIQRCGVTNTVVSQHEGANLCSRLKKMNFFFDKILLDAPCSGEGTIRLNPKTASMFNENLIKKMSNIQKSLISSAFSILKIGGEMTYSTCTHGPEENEEVISYLLENFPAEIQKINLPIKSRKGIKEWKGKKFHPDVEKAARIYPQDNNTEGFFIAKFKKIGEKEKY